MAECNQKIFQGKGGFMELGHSDKHVKNTRKKSRRETFWSFFSYILLKPHFERLEKV